MPMSHLDLERVTFGDNLTIGFAPCEAQLRQVTLRVPSTTIGSPISGFGEPAGTNGATTDRPTTLVMDRCQIEGGDPAISLGELASFQITNTIFRNQGTSHGAVLLSGAKLTTSTISFSTLFNSLMKCPVGPADGGFASANNIVFYQRSGAPTDAATGTYCTHSYDLVKPQSTSLRRVGNILNMDPKLVAPPLADVHLMVGSPAIDAADPNAALGIDYDGTMRPQGAARDIGALEYKP